MICDDITSVLSAKKMGGELFKNCPKLLLIQFSQYQITTLINLKQTIEVLSMSGLQLNLSNYQLYNFFCQVDEVVRL